MSFRFPLLVALSRGFSFGCGLPPVQTDMTSKSSGTLRKSMVEALKRCNTMVQQVWHKCGSPPCEPTWVGSRNLMGWCTWWFGLATAPLVFWVRFPNEGSQGKETHPVFKYRVNLTSPSTCPALSSSPHANSFVIGPAVLNINKCVGSLPRERANNP